MKKKKAYKLASLWLSRNNQCYCWELLAARFYCFALGQKAVFIWHSRCSLYISLCVLFCCFSPNQTNTQCIHSSPLIAFVGARFDSRPDRESFFFSLGLIDATRSSASAAAYSRIRAWRSTSNSMPTNGVLSSSDEWKRDIRSRFSLLRFMLTRWTWEEFQNDLAISQWIWIWFNSFLINHCPTCVSLSGRWKGRNAHYTADYLAFFRL